MAEFKMRLSDDDEEKLAACEAWYHGVPRAGVMRLALIELHRYVIGARKRKEDAAILAEHRAKQEPARFAAAVRGAVRGAGTEACGVGEREWNGRMDEIIAQRKRDGLSTLPYEALLAASKA